MKPPFTAVFVDDRGFVWVSVSLPAGQQGSAFDVFDPEGRYLGPVQMTRTIGRYVVIRGSDLHALVWDEDAVPAIARYRIVNR